MDGRQNQQAELADFLSSSLSGCSSLAAGAFEEPVFVLGGAGVNRQDHHDPACSSDERIHQGTSGFDCKQVHAGHALILDVQSSNIQQVVHTGQKASLLCSCSCQDGDLLAVGMQPVPHHCLTGQEAVAIPQ